MEKVIRRLQDREALASLVGESPRFVEVIERLPAISRSDASVLITGETGTGKELVARAIHYLSRRADHACVTVNCGALPESLGEEELFGHERGVFTGAHAPRKGLVVEAHGGTLFLDEVQAMPERTQVGLLRVLQEKRSRAIGSNVENLVDIRVVAASCRSLESEVRAGAFRDDLYYRLCVFTIQLPPLRERKEDIPRLSQHFLVKHLSESRAPVRFGRCTFEAMLSYNWPGNVRELENAVVRAIHLCQDGVIEPQDLGLPVTGKPPSRPLGALGAMKRAAIERFERHYLTELMRQHRGNVTRAALTAGKERRELGKLLKKYGLDARQFREPAAAP